MRKLLVFLLILFSYCTACSQSLSVFNIETSGFPTIKANFYAYDASGNQITNLNTVDFRITENKLPRTVKNVTCPNPKPPIQLSSVLTIDVSGSMKGLGMNIAKAAAKTWVNCIDLTKSECAVTSFDNLNYMNQDFTTNRNGLLEAIDSLKPQGQTDYDYALINPVAGGLVLSKSGHYKRVIILLTDGLPQTDPQVDKIITTANDQDCVIYSVVIGMTCPKSLKDISEQTGGEWFENITNAEEAKEIYLNILATEQDVKPCEIEWESTLTCRPDRINCEINLNGLIAKTDYIPSDNSVAKLEVFPKFTYFGRVKLGKKVDTTLKLIAHNSDFTISDIKIKNGSNAYALKGVTFPIYIKKNDSATIQIRYAPIDSTLNYTAFEIETDVCSSSFSMVGGYGGQKPLVNPLKLTHPNGGEKFVIGGDTLITWEGIAETDTVSLEYSIDSGKTWILITDTATGLKYVWKNVPPPTSNDCLVRVKLINTEASQDATPFLEWEKTYKGFHASSIHPTFDGGYILCGSKSKSAPYYGDVDYNIWIVKLDNLGNVEWEKTYGSRYWDVLCSIEQSTDGGYILAGYWGHNPNGGSLSGLFYVLKTDNIGNEEWSQTYNSYLAKSIQETNDGGYIVAGSGDGKNSSLLFKLNNKGVVEWEKSDKEFEKSQFNSVQQTKDGGYIVVGNVYTSNNSNDYLIVKFDSIGKTLWKKHFGGNLIDNAESVFETFDGGFIVAGATASKNGDITENKGMSDYWLIKLDKTGTVEWQKTYGGSSFEGLWPKDSSENDYNINLTGYSSIFQNADGGYIFAGFTNSDDGDISFNKGWIDLWVVKLDKSGNIKWENTYGGSNLDEAYQVQPTYDGGFVIVGRTDSNDGDVSDSIKAYSPWVLKFGNKVAILPEDVSDTVFSIVGPEPIAKNIDMKKWIIYLPKDSIIENFISNIGTYKFRVDSIYFRGADAKAFSLVSGFPKYSLEPTTSKNTEFRFIPNRIGIHQAEIVIITQADTLIQTIQGEGIAPQIQVLNKYIDFGLVNIGKSRDTLQAFTIKNIGTVPITITKTKNNKPNDYDFATISGGGSFTLNPGDTAKLDLRFTPSFIGKTSGTLEFYYEGVGSPAIVMLYGEGLKKRAMIETSIPKFSDLVCEYSTTAEVSIHNFGGSVLAIKELNLTGPDKSDFSINETLPINLPPDSTKTITIGFKTNVPGVKTAALEIKSNADPDSVLTIPLTVRKDSIALVPNPITIDLGTLFPNQTKDTSFVISNLGNIKTDGKVSFTSNISCANPTFTIDSGGVYKLDFTFTGLPSDGNINEIITVWDEVCKYSREVLITGKVVSPHLLGFSATQCKSYSNEYNLTLQNPSSNRLKITSIEIEQNPQLFEIDPNLVFPITIEPYTSNYEVNVKYKDDIAQKFATAVNCLTDNKFIPILTDTIYVETVEYKRTTSGLINDTIRGASNPFAVSYDSTSLNGKNKFTYSIIVNESVNDMDYLTELSDLQVLINYNRNVLGADFDLQNGQLELRLSNEISANYTIKTAKETKIDEFNSQIIVNLENTGKAIITKNSYKLFEIDFSAYLGKENLTDAQNNEKSRSAIITHIIKSSDECISYETAANAYLDIEKICTDDIRSIKLPTDTSAKFYLGAVIPHPIGTKGATIEYGLGFECQVTLTIYDIAGTVILVPLNEIQKAGIHKQTISSKSLSAGAYFIEMKAGPFKETKRVIVE